LEPGFHVVVLGLVVDSRKGMEEHVIAKRGFRSADIAINNDEI